MEKNNPGLDMKHGFIHHIRWNQFKRDKYDKEVRCNVSKPRSRKTDKHPDKKVYRAKREEDSDIDKGLTKMENSGACGRTLYKLEYTDSTGRVHKVEVHKFDDPSNVARKLAIAAKIPNELLETLEWKIRQDIAKRNA